LTDKFSKFLYAGGTLGKKAMISGATFISSGFKKGGNYMKSKLNKNKEETKVSEGTQNKIKLAKTATNSVFVFAKTGIQSLIKMAGTIGK